MFPQVFGRRPPKRQTGLVPGSPEHRRRMQPYVGHETRLEDSSGIVGLPRPRDTQEPRVGGGQEGPRAEK